MASDEASPVTHAPRVKVQHNLSMSVYPAIPFDGLFKRQSMSPATVRFSLVYAENHGSFLDDHPYSHVFLIVANTRVSIR